VDREKGEYMKKCFLWNHNWSKWETVDKGTITSYLTISQDCFVGIWAKQERTCKDCGKLQIRIERDRI